MIKKFKLGLGTIVSITVDHPDDAEARKLSDLAFREIDRIEKLMSVYNPLSEISVLNRNGFFDNISPDTKKVIQKAKYYYGITHGFFDVTIFPLLKVREKLSEKKINIGEFELEKALELVCSDWVIVDNKSVRFKKKGMSINLGAVAKGYAVDLALKALKENGIKRAMVDAGGDIKVIGGKSYGKPWRIGIRDPGNKKKIESVIQMRDNAVATSGTYNRQVHDMINPHNARIADGITRATVVAEDAVDADALSTAIYMLGTNRGLKLAEKKSGVEALILTKNGERLKTSGWSEIIHHKK